MLAPPLELRLSISSSLSLGESGVSDADVPHPPPPCSEEALRSTESPGCRVCWEERGCSVMMSTWEAEAPSAPTTDAESKKIQNQSALLVFLYLYFAKLPQLLVHFCTQDDGSHLWKLQWWPLSSRGHPPTHPPPQRAFYLETTVVRSK